MNIFKSLKLQFRPPKMDDPDFGQLTFIYISNHPERSYWEAEWIFPPTGTSVCIGLDGDESGPRPDTREWHLELPSRFPQILELARHPLSRVLKSWPNQNLPENIFSIVALSGFGVIDPLIQPVEWDISFETTGDKWLSITIPFVGHEPKEPVVDT
jgi:hypothetical protein